MIEKESISARVNPGIWKRSRIRAEQEGKKIGVFLEEALKDKLKKKMEVKG